MLASMVFMRPVFGEPRIAQATAATSGGTKSGSRPAVAISPFQGVLVRTTIQAKARPMARARAVPPVQATNELRSAEWTLGLASTAVKLSIDMSEAWNVSTTGLT